MLGSCFPRVPQNVAPRIGFRLELLLETMTGELKAMVCSSPLRKIAVGCWMLLMVCLSVVLSCIIECESIVYSSEMLTLSD